MNTFKTASGTISNTVVCNKTDVYKYTTFFICRIFMPVPFMKQTKLNSQGVR